MLDEHFVWWCAVHLVVHIVTFLFSCSIFPSPEPNPGLSHYQGSLNTGGSLPDLTNLHFPSPLSTPLDPEDNNGCYPNLSGGSSTGNLPAAMMHLGISNSQGELKLRGPPCAHNLFMRLALLVNWCVSHPSSCWKGLKCAHSFFALIPNLPSFFFFSSTLGSQINNTVQQ